MHRYRLPLLFAVVAACGGPPGSGARTTTEVAAPQPMAVEHDFGTIPHGEARTLDYAIDVHALGGAYYALRAQLDCSCGHGQIVLRDRQGKERFPDGVPRADNRIGDDEELLVRVTVDTKTKDPVDLPAVTSRGVVVLQPIDDATGLRRVSWPFLVRFAIECPVEVKPPAVDFGIVPQSALPELRIALAGDPGHRGVTFGAPQSSSQALQVVLDPDGEGTALRIRCVPGEPGNAQGVVTVPTDLPGGYEVHLGVKWKVVPDLVASPMDKLSFQAVLERAQTPEEAQSQYLQVTNHDLRSAVEFSVHAIVDDAGQDASSHFAVRFEPVPNLPRCRRMFVRYTGGLDGAFRGSITLTVAAGVGPFLPITLLLFPKKS